MSRLPSISEGFQSTLPLRGATLGGRLFQLERISFQSTLPLRGATFGFFPGLSGYVISIHAPLTGSDAIIAYELEDKVQFQSTLPLRGATGDRKAGGLGRSNFNPRSPYGERPAAIETGRQYIDFNPRSPYGERRMQ